jgi:hypothetical protein
MLHVVLEGMHLEPRFKPTLSNHRLLAFPSLMTGIFQGTALALAVIATPLAGAEAGIVNVVSAMNTEAPEGLSGDISASADLNDGNSDLFIIGLSPLVRYREDKHFFAAIVRSEYGESNDDRILFRSFGHLRYRYRFDGRWLGELFTQHEFDEFRSLSLRSLVGFGPKIDLVKREDRELGLGVAYMLEYEKLRNSSAGDDAGESHVNHRLSSYLTGRFEPAERVEILQTFYAQPRLDRPKDIRLLSQSQVSVKATTTVALTTALTIAYDSRPADTVKRTDVTLKSSVSWSF